MQVPIVSVVHDPPAEGDFLRAAAVWGKMEVKNGVDHRLQVIKEFESRSTDHLHIVVQDGTIREGYDLPLISVCGILRNVGSVSLFGQFVGRGVRKLLQSYVGEGIPISPADNVCHIVTHAM